MKTLLSIVIAMLWLVIYSTNINAGQADLPNLEHDGFKAKAKATPQSRKQLPPPAELQTPTRTEVRPVLKSTSPYKSLPNDERKESKDSMVPVN